MDTPIYWETARAMNMDICGSRGPRIGNEGVPFCKMLPGHASERDWYHRPDPDDGWGPIQWQDW